MKRLKEFERRLIRCRRCPRLTDYLRSIRKHHPDWWCKPVPGLGTLSAPVVLVGLAPGRTGSNRTGKMFTGDASGRFLFRALHRIGWASDPDGRRVREVYITAAVRCAPPGNRPIAAEMDRCRRWLEWELRLLARAQVFVALGRIAHDAVLRVFGLRPSAARFRHGAVHRLPDGRRLVDSYHPSRQNTQTGRLTPAMLLRALRRARALAARSG